MHVHIIKNVFSEGPGTMIDHFRDEGIPYTITDLSIGEAIPDKNSFTHLLIMGGPMAVYEMQRYPYLGDEASLIEAAIKADKYVMGVCLGAQMIAHVLGARVYPGSKKEVGWHEVSLTQEGMRDPMLSVLAIPGKSIAQVFQLHGDTFDLPNRAVRLASSDLYPNQAFRYGTRVYALQFHIEVTPIIVQEWLAADQTADLASITEASKRIYEDYRERAKKFYTIFFKK